MSHTVNIVNLCFLLKCNLRVVVIFSLYTVDVLRCTSDFLFWYFQTWVFHLSVGTDSSTSVISNQVLEVVELPVNKHCLWIELKGNFPSRTLDSWSNSQRIITPLWLQAKMIHTLVSLLFLTASFISSLKQFYVYVEPDRWDSPHKASGWINVWKQHRCRSTKYIFQ